MFDVYHLHPMVVHFPIALIMVGFLADFIYLFYKKEPALQKTGFYLMFLGALAALVALLTGEFFTSHPSEGEIMGIFEKHETGAWVTLIAIAVGVVIRIYLLVAKKENTPWKWLVLACYLVAFVAVSITGFLGGTMVYNYMIGL